MIYNTLYIVYNRLPNIHVRQCIFNAGVVLYIVCREIYQGGRIRTHVSYTYVRPCVHILQHPLSYSTVCSCVLKRIQIRIYDPLRLDTRDIIHTNCKCVVLSPQHSTVLVCYGKMLTAVNLFNTFILYGRCERKPHVMNGLLKSNTHHARLMSSTFTFNRIRCRFHPSSNTAGASFTQSQLTSHPLHSDSFA